MNLFALLRDSNRPLVRIPLTAGVQADLQKIFEEQEAKFREQAQERIEFDGKYRPDGGEYLSIKDYDDIDNVHYAIANPLNIKEIRSESAEFENIKGIFTGSVVNGVKKALFQSFDKRRVLSTKGYTIIEDITQPKEAYKKVEGVGLSLDYRLSAILTDKELDFFSFFAVRQLFDMTDYYQLATNDDLKSFSDNAKISIHDFGEFVGVSDAYIRRKVVLVTQSGILDKIDVEEAKIAASAFNITIELAEIDGRQVIVLPSEKKDLKLVLKFLDEDYFHSVLTKRPLVSNSKRNA